MIKPERIAALVPMRHHSQRVVGKNYRLLAGKPLYYHILETLMACPEIQTIVVDTDSPVIKAGLQKDFPGVVVIDRPAHLLADTIPMNEILLHDTSQVAADLYLQTHSTNPLLRPQTIELAIEKYLELLETFDSLFSVTRLQTRLYWRDGSPINHNPQELLRTQDLPPVYEENSNFYIFSRKSFFDADNSRIGLKPQMFEMNKLEAVDIDEPEDWEIAESLYRRQMNK